MLLQALSWAGVVFLGLVLGSFSSALIYRVPRGISWVWNSAQKSPADKNKKSVVVQARSACPMCSTPLGFLDLIPFFSWLFLKGRCRHCGGRIGWVYPLAELGTLLGCAGIYLAWGPGVEGGLAFLMVPFLVALLFIDLEHYILPNQLVLICGVLGLLSLLYAFCASHMDVTVLPDRLLGALLFPVTVWAVGRVVGKVLKKDALGLGDVKFLAAAGIWLGITVFPYYLVMSGVIGTAVGIGWRLAGKGEIFPFGPALVVSLYLLLILKGYLVI